MAATGWSIEELAAATGETSERIAEYARVGLLLSDAGVLAPDARRRVELLQFARSRGVTDSDLTTIPERHGDLLAGSTPDPSTHLVLVHVQATARVTTLLPATAFHLRGLDGRLLPADTIEGGEECQAIGDGITAAPQAPTAPTPVCFDIAHAAFSDFSLIVDLPGRGQLTIPLPPA